MSALFWLYVALIELAAFITLATHCARIRLNLHRIEDSSMDVKIGVLATLAINPLTLSGMPADVTNVAWSVSPSEAGLIAISATDPKQATFTSTKPGPVVIAVVAQSKAGAQLSDSATLNVIDDEAASLNLTVALAA